MTIELRASSLEGKVAVVTGGASGIGQACAELLAARGARVIVTDVNLEGAQRVARGCGALAVKLDVSAPASLETAIAFIEKEAGPVELLLHSAGIIQGTPVPPEELSLDVWDRVMSVDLRGTYLTCVAFGGRMAKRGRGAIVNIASIAGMRSTPLHVYAPAKAGVIHMTRCLASEWGRSGVRVNAISPGYVLTPVIQEAIAKGLRDPKLMEEGAAAGHMVKPEDIARAAAFLLSEEAGAITGINLPVDHGWLVGTSWRTYGGLRPARATMPAPGDEQS